MYQIFTDVDKVDKVEWVKFVKTHANGNFFQSPDYYSFIESTGEAEPFIIAAKHNSNLIAVLVGSMYFSRGFLKPFTRRAIIIGGPIVDQKFIKELTPLLLSSLQKIVNGIYIEFRNLFEISNGELFINKGYKYLPYINYLFDLTKGEKKIFESFKAEKRRQIRKALKNNVKIELANNLKDIEELYLIFKDLYTKKVKKPLPRYKFFKNFYLQLAKNNNGLVLILKKNNKIIGGSFCPLFNNKTIYDWYRAGDDKNHKKSYPSTLAAWAGIDYGLSNGYKMFDFMGAGRKDEFYGVRKFKSQFRGELVEHGRYLKVLNPFLYNLGKIGVKLLSKLS